MARGLTQRQQEILAFIKGFIGERGYPPTVREIGAHFGIEPSSVFDHLKALERKGYLRRGSAHRSLELLEWADRGQSLKRLRAIPILGRIAVGKPLLAVEHLEETLLIDPEWVGEAEVFCLRVQGDSLIGAHIQEGDYALVRRQETADSGDLVVALLDEEATIKRFVKQGEVLLLQPEHPDLEPLVIKPGEARVQILGKVIGILRKL